MLKSSPMEQQKNYSAIDAEKYFNLSARSQVLPAILATYIAGGMALNAMDIQNSKLIDGLMYVYYLGLWQILLDFGKLKLQQNHFYKKNDIQRIEDCIRYGVLGKEDLDLQPLASHLFEKTKAKIISK